MPTYELTFVVDPVDEEKEVALLEDDINLVQHGQLQYVYISVRARSGLAAASAAISRLHGHGVNVLRARLDLVNKAEIAERAGVSRPAVQKWTQLTGDDGFPPEHDHGPLGTVWVWEDVNAWLRMTGKAHGEADRGLRSREVATVNAHLARSLSTDGFASEAESLERSLHSTEA